MFRGIDKKGRTMFLFGIPSEAFSAEEYNEALDYTDPSKPLTKDFHYLIASVRRRWEWNTEYNPIKEYWEFSFIP
jgi:hypothetical protein